MSARIGGRKPNEPSAANHRLAMTTSMASMDSLELATEVASAWTWKMSYWSAHRRHTTKLPSTAERHDAVGTIVERHKQVVRREKGRASNLV